jgi:hypothetical protein
VSGVSGGSGDALARPNAASQNPARLLANLMDFPGSVALADLLAEPLARFCSRAEPRASTAPQGATARLPASTAAGAATPADCAALGERLQLDAEARLDSLEQMVLKPLLGRRAPGVPAAHELLFSLRQYRIHEHRSDANVTRLADHLGAPFRSALGLSLRQAQAQVATLRWEITHDLRALGPRAEQLERLDAALSRSMQAKLGELLDRMEHAAHLTFVRACGHAVEGLPEGLDEAALAAWCDPEGWLARYRERCVRMARALFGHLRRSLEGLIRAAALVDSEQASADRSDAWFGSRAGARASTDAGDQVAHTTCESNTEDA